ncbi:efflux RND transporter periplasmic adaptor subunit [bacterium]|nr:efflux RND transporter periplasmic adaptor subunit [bacterium]
MFSRKRLIYSLIAILVVSYIVYSLVSGNRVDATTTVIQKSTLTVSIRNEGRTRLLESYVVTSPVSGELKRVALQVGDPVVRGGMVFQVLPPESSNQEESIQQANVQAANAQVELAATAIEEAEDNQAQARTILKRQEALKADGIVTEEQLEQATIAAASADRNLESAKLSLQAAEAELTAAKTRLTTSSQAREAMSTAAYAPTDGNVLRIFERSQRMIAAGTPVLEIGNARSLELVVDVLSEDAVQIKPGNPVDVTGWGGESLKGKVRLVEPSAFTKISALGVEEQRVNVLIDFDSIPESLGVGYRAEAAIIIQEAPETLTVPVSAIFQESGTWFTFAVVDDMVEKRAIEIGTRAADKVEVMSGLVEGDEVVLFPSASIVSGAKIKR